jgi:hypothetical protein
MPSSSISSASSSWPFEGNSTTHWQRWQITEPAHQMKPHAFSVLYSPQVEQYALDIFIIKERIGF